MVHVHVYGSMDKIAKIFTYWKKTKVLSVYQHSKLMLWMVKRTVSLTVLLSTHNIGFAYEAVLVNMYNIRFDISLPLRIYFWRGLLQICT